MYDNIIAVDFDGTLCESSWPDIGKPIDRTITYLLNEREKGSKLILWTCREGAMLSDAVRWCEERGLYFDAVNDNLPEISKKFGGNSRKIFANVYIDDRNAFLLGDSDNIKWALDEISRLCCTDRGNECKKSSYMAAMNAYGTLLECAPSLNDAYTVLSSLLNGETLTPIRDENDIWEEVEGTSEKCYQCKRLKSLFKLCGDDGSVTYDDARRVVYYDLLENKKHYCDGYIRHEINKIFPIEMPYAADETINVYCEKVELDNCEFAAVYKAVKTNKNGKICGAEDVNKYFRICGSDIMRISWDDFKNAKYHNWSSFYEND